MEDLPESRFGAPRSAPERRCLEWSNGEGGGVQLAFRRIPAGEFTMGASGYENDEEPPHRVTLTGEFWLGETPVTQEQFGLWTQAAAIEHENGFPGRPGHPAENVSWRDAVGFCAWLTRTKCGEFPEGMTLACLPTEAEWEYACRAGTATQYWNGDGEAALAEVAWYEENAGGGSRAVGTKPANGWGLHDLHGNVWEWCHDAWNAQAYRDRPEGARDPGQAERWDDYARPLADGRIGEDRLRVLRGGSWGNEARACRSAFRLRDWPDGRLWFRGFRVGLVRGRTAE
ncbi:MAG: formylglycine-generating enzyme family protein [Verrucomicrobia bacterium]|nr:formylglycine-generating enzyme family protein [Verrucomicrobiota bacterium]